MSMFEKIDVPWMLLLGLALLTIILLRRSTRYYGRRRKKGSSAATKKSLPRVSSNQPRSDIPLIDAPGEITRWQVEMHETARDLKGEMDSKMIALQALVRMADEATEGLREAIERAERLGVSELGDTLEEIQRLSDDLSSETLAAASDDAQLGNLPPLPAEAEGLLPDDDRRRMILALSDDGQSAAEIAQKTGAALGDVELILGESGGSSSV